MKKRIANLAFGTILLLNQLAFSQNTNKPLKNSIKMENVKNQTEIKNVVTFLYDSIFNKRQFEKLPEIISDNYTNPFGGKGSDGFKKSMIDLVNAFPDGHWIIEEIIAEGNKVVVKQKFKGTQKNQFQNIKPTNNKVSVDGIATYEIENKRIVKSQIQTDRLAFLQQLGSLPLDLSNVSYTKEDSNTVYFIDKIIVPKRSRDEFMKQMKATNTVIKTLPGYIRGEMFEQFKSEENSVILTIAVWENEEKLNMAKISVQNEFKRIGFNPMEFFNRLNIKMEREEYTNLKE